MDNVIFKMGHVDDCKKLRIRKEPSTEALILGAISFGMDVLIDEESSTDEFYKVITPAGMEGYCMKKYISIDEQGE